MLISGHEREELVDTGHKKCMRKDEAPMSPTGMPHGCRQASCSWIIGQSFMATHGRCRVQYEVQGDAGYNMRCRAMQGTVQGPCKL